MLTDVTVSFEQLGPGKYFFSTKTYKSRLRVPATYIFMENNEKSLAKPSPNTPP